MANLYYLDTNALIKYSVYQQYLTKPEEGVETIRTLINKNTGIFYISRLTLWEFHNVFLKYYRAFNTDRGIAFGSRNKERKRKFMRILSEIQDGLKKGVFVMDNTALSAKIFLKTQTLMQEYGFIQQRKLDSIDALHIALIQFLNTQNDEKITLVSADKVMIEISEQEGLSVLAI